MIAFAISAFVLFVLLLCFAFGTKQEKDNDVPSGGGSDSMSDTSQTNGYGTSTSIKYPNGKGGRNNPGYLISVESNHWQGEEESEGYHFENFSDIKWGVRAWYVNLFGKVKKGQITNTEQMIDILTPAGSENSEEARNNYKASVAKATDWMSLGRAVFDFESNPDWENLPATAQSANLEFGFEEAVQYRYGGQVPNYFKS